MKYKEGDIVKIVARNCGHKFDIGEIVRITYVGKHGYLAEYLDGHDFWIIEDDEIEPANNIITRSHDYTGCDPEIAEALKQGFDVYCEVWDEDSPAREEWIGGYNVNNNWPYETEDGEVFNHARPIRQEPKPKTKLVPKPASEIFAWLENPENGYYLEGYIWKKDENPSFVPDMIKHCGTDDCGDWNWHPAWLREVAVAEPGRISETSENSQQLYKVGDVVEVTAEKYCHGYELGDTVEIIEDDTDGTYKCKRLSDGYVQWLAPEYFKHIPKIQTATTIHKVLTIYTPEKKLL